MNSPPTLLILAGILMALAACGATGPADKNTTVPDLAPAQNNTRLRDAVALAAMGRAAIVTTGSPRLDPAKPSRISWLGRLDVMGEHQTLSSEELRQHLSTIINNQIMAKGYPIVSEGGDFQLQAVVVLVDKQDESALLRASGGIDPGLAGSDQLSGKSSLVLELKQGRVTRWKGTVQIYIAPQFDQTIALRRIEYAVEQLLGTWP